MREEVQIYQEECERLKIREKNLTNDIKKRGDAARQLIMAKDDEIQKLKNSSLERNGEKPANQTPSTPLANPEKFKNRTDHSSPPLNFTFGTTNSSFPDLTETKYESIEIEGRKAHQIHSVVSTLIIYN